MASGHRRGQEDWDVHGHTSWKVANVGPPAVISVPLPRGRGRGGRAQPGSSSIRGGLRGALPPRPVPLTGSAHGGGGHKSNAPPRGRSGNRGRPGNPPRGSGFRGHERGRDDADPRRPSDRWRPWGSGSHERAESRDELRRPGGPSSSHRSSSPRRDFPSHLPARPHWIFDEPGPSTHPDRLRFVNNPISSSSSTSSPSLPGAPSSSAHPSSSNQDRPTANGTDHAFGPPELPPPSRMPPTSPRKCKRRNEQDHSTPGAVPTSPEKKPVVMPSSGTFTVSPSPDTHEKLNTNTKLTFKPSKPSKKHEPLPSAKNLAVTEDVKPNIDELERNQEEEMMNAQKQTEGVLAFKKKEVPPECFGKVPGKREAARSAFKKQQSKFMKLSNRKMLQVLWRDDGVAFNWVEMDVAPGPKANGKAETSSSDFTKPSRASSHSLPGTAKTPESTSTVKSGPSWNAFKRSAGSDTADEPPATGHKAKKSKTDSNDSLSTKPGAKAPSPPSRVDELDAIPDDLSSKATKLKGKRKPANTATKTVSQTGTLDKLVDMQASMREKFDDIDMWTTISKDYPDDTEKLSRQIARTQHEIFELQQRIKEEKQRLAAR